MQGATKQQKFIKKVGVISLSLFHAVATKQIYCQKLGFIKLLNLLNTPVTDQIN